MYVDTVIFNALNMSIQFMLKTQVLEVLSTFLPLNIFMQLQIKFYIKGKCVPQICSSQTSNIEISSADTNVNLFTAGNRYLFLFDWNWIVVIKL